jgi:maltose-binding protein MalE
MITELAAFIITLSSRVRIRDSYEYGFRELFIDIYKNNHTDLQYVVENLEREFKCCGAHNVTDYYKYNYTVPATCHQDEDVHKPIFNEGCADAVIKWLWNQSPIIGGALGGILLIEMFGVIASIALGIAISHSSYYK